MRIIYPGKWHWVPAALGWLLTLATFYPGYMSYDSIHQLMEARAFSFSDHHPPLMAFLWHFVDLVIPGPGGMLAIQAAVYWFAINLLARGASTAASRIALWTVGYLPPVFVYLGTIWKDVGLGVFLLLGFALLDSYSQTRKRASLAGALVCLVYGMSLRHNGAFAALPLFLAAGFLWKDRRSVALAAGVGLFVASIGITLLVPRLLGSEKRYIWQAIPLYDLIGISALRGEVLLPKALVEQNPGLNGSNVAQIYSSEAVDFSLPPFHPELRGFGLTVDKEQLDDLVRTWVRVVEAHPSDYLAHRSAVFRNLMGIGRATVYYPFHAEIDANPLDIHLHRTFLNKAYSRVLERTKNSFLFRGWVYLAALLVLGSVAFVSNRILPLAAVSGALAVLVSNYFLAPAADFRYCWWAVLVVAVIGVRIIGDWADWHSKARSTLLRTRGIL